MGLNTEIAGTWVAFGLTLMVFSYLIKEIPLFQAIYRVAAYLFIGVSLGYGAVVAWHSVLVPRLLTPLEGREWWYLVPVVLCLLLLVRISRGWRGVSSVTIAFVFGVGVALALGGAIAGTLVPQVKATFLSLNPAHYQAVAAQEGDVPLYHALNALLVVIGTVSALFYFHFTAESGWRRGWLLNARRWILDLSTGLGKVFIMFALGALFATSAVAFISLLVDRVRFIVETVWSHLPAP
jgi:hypothetical protein